MAKKKTKTEAPEPKKVVTKKFKLKKQYLSDKGLLNVGDTIEVGKNGETYLKSENII